MLLLLGLGDTAGAVCRGKDLLPELQRQKPAVVNRIDQEAARMPFANGKLFRVTKGGVSPSYFFGTIHSGDTRVTNFSPALLKIVDDASSVAFELKEVGGMNDPEVQQQMGLSLLTHVMASSDDKVSALFPPAEQEKIRGLAGEYGIPVEAVDIYKAGFLALAFSIPVCEAKNHGKIPGVDELLARRVMSDGKSIIGLETIAEQLEATADHPPETQKALLASVVQSNAMLEDLFETTIRFYAAGEIGKLLLWSKSEELTPGTDAVQATEAVMATLIDMRNRRMFDRSRPLVDKGNAFVAVGAAHLPGETGVLRLYEKAGYTVERVE
jgi:uncharacterized protein YbaP (TraB family)